MVVMTITEYDRQVTEGSSIQNRGPRRCNQQHSEDEGRREGRWQEG